MPTIPNVKFRTLNFGMGAISECPNILKPAKSDIGIKVLQDLNNMSELLGNVMNTLINIMTTINTFTTQLVIGLCLIVSFIISCRYLLSERKRDYILISIMFILVLVFINRNRL